MNKLKVLFFTLLLSAFAAPINAKIVVLNAEVAMLSTQYAQEAFKTLDVNMDGDISIEEFH